MKLGIQSGDHLRVLDSVIIQGKGFLWLDWNLSLVRTGYHCVNQEKDHTRFRLSFYFDPTICCVNRKEQKKITESGSVKSI